MQTNAIVEVENVFRSVQFERQALHILRGISFTVETGEWVAITGPSGSGKSTLLGILAGIDRPTSGQVSIAGVNISSMSEGKLARIRNQMLGVVFQSFHLIPTMTAQENVEAPLYISARRKNARALARQMLETVGLGERCNHLPHQLSGGEQQRVAIARALVNGPRLLLADEPTGNLDSATSEQVMALIGQLRNQLGLTVIMVTHDAQIAARADRQLHLADGQFAENARAAARQIALGALPGEVRS